MALLSALELAYLRKQFFSSLSGEELAALAAQLEAATAAANSAAAGAQTAADAAAATANARATVGYVDSSVAGLASEAHVAAAVAGLASKTYVDGKFAAGRFTGDVVVASQSAGETVTMTFVDGWLMSYVDSGAP